ncbi:MAG: methyltransferase domain-containing protein [Candidatus Obscuribacterales bacterium]|nr:methyltransferase domain-containing protein [Candidatus Obscuribacterales bacterium]
MLTLAKDSLRTDAVTITYNRQIARNYECDRKIEAKRLDDLVKLIFEHTSGEGRILDLGCGTGVFTTLLAGRLPMAVTGADNSEEMLAIARSKPEGRGIDWHKEDAVKLSYENESFDVVFMSNLLHHFNNPLDIIQQCARVLKPGGLLLNHFGALEDIIKDPDHKFFEKASELDVRRTPARIQMEYLLKSAGLTDIGSDKNTYKLCNSAAERVKMVESKYISVFHLMDQISFQRGLSRLRRYAESNQFDPWLREITVTTTFGIKPC